MFRSMPWRIVFSPLADVGLTSACSQQNTDAFLGRELVEAGADGACFLVDGADGDGGLDQVSISASPRRVV